MRPPSRKSGPRRAPKQVVSRHDADLSSDDNEAFQSPEREDATDYGLEFTTSRLNAQETPRRCSTLRKQPTSAHHRELPSSDEEEENSEEEDTEHQPSSNIPSRQTRNSERAVAQSSSRHQVVRQQQAQVQPMRAAPAQQGQNSRPRRRKQMNPESRMKQLKREVLRLQAMPGFLIPRLPFSRLVREIILQLTNVRYLMTVGAMEALQTASEMYLTQRFQDAYLLTMHRGRVTLEVRDMVLVAFFCRSHNHL